MRTEDELREAIDQVYYAYYPDTFSGFLKQKGLYCQGFEENWKDILADYEKWLRGEAFASQSEELWLFAHWSNLYSYC